MSKMVREIAEFETGVSFREMMTKVAAAYLHRESRRMLDRRGGIKMVTYANEHVGLVVDAMGYYEFEELEATFSFLSPLATEFQNGVALDIGANIGNHSIYFSPRFCRVHAFEPHPVTSKILAINAQQLGNIVVHAYGLGEENGTVRLVENPTNLGGSRVSDMGELSVEIRRLDDVMAETSDFFKIRLIKLDVEGYEAKVLRGAEKLLHASSPVVLFELHEEDFQKGRPEVMKILEQFGYRFCWFAPRAGGAIVRYGRLLRELMRGRRRWVVCTGEDIPDGNRGASRLAERIGAYMTPLPVPRFTVFTPTYNRAHTLPRLYASIRRQTVRDFEWVIVDDGSTDGTEALVRRWQDEDNDFPIRYFWQPNQHKKVAFNRGVQEARGEWFVCIDSDDELLPNALENFQRIWESIPESERDRFAGVVGLCVDAKGNIVVDKFPRDLLDASSIELYFDYGVRGEKLVCLRTSVLRAYPFPEEVPGYVPENVVWFRIARRYILRCANVPVRVYHQDVESLMRPSDPRHSKVKNAEGAYLSNIETLECVTWRRLCRAPRLAFYHAVQCVRWGTYLPKAVRCRYRVHHLSARVLVITAWPVGWLLQRLDQWGATERLRGALARFGLRFP